MRNVEPSRTAVHEEARLKRGPYEAFNSRIKARAA